MFKYFVVDTVVKSAFSQMIGDGVVRGAVPTGVSGLSLGQRLGKHKFKSFTECNRAADSVESGGVEAGVVDYIEFTGFSAQNSIFMFIGRC